MRSPSPLALCNSMHLHYYVQEQNLFFLFIFFYFGAVLRVFFLSYLFCKVYLFTIRVWRVVFIEFIFRSKKLDWITVQNLFLLSGGDDDECGIYRWAVFCYMCLTQRQQNIRYTCAADTCCASDDFCCFVVVIVCCIRWDDRNRREYMVIALQ